MPRHRALGASLLILVATGCAELPLLRGQSITLHKEGYLIEPGEGRRALEKNEFQVQAVAEIVAGIDSYVRRERATGTAVPQILIFVHGGLNTYRASLGRAHALVDAGKKAQSYPRLSSYHLLFVNWNSSLFSSLWDGVFVIRRGERAPYTAPLTAPFVLGGQLTESTATAPRAWAFQIENAIDSFSTSEKEGEREEDRVRVGFGYFLLFPVRALTVPFIQGFGTPAWEMMKRRADLAIAVTKNMQTNPYADEGGVRTLMNALKERMCQPAEAASCAPHSGQALWKVAGESQFVPIEITLIGHSMGAMILNRVLAEFSEVPFRHLVYLAAASSIDDFESAALPYLRQHQGTNVWGFALSDSDESREGGVFDIYERGSLLVWIDNFFERLVTPTQKTFGRYRNYHRRYRDLPQAFAQRVCVKKFAGTEGEPTRHGAFSEPGSVERILNLVKVGACPSGDFW